MYIQNENDSSSILCYNLLTTLIITILLLLLALTTAFIKLPTNKPNFKRSEAAEKKKKLSRMELKLLCLSFIITIIKINYNS